MAQIQQPTALIKNNLQIPLIIRDFLKSRTAPSDAEHYALHDIMSGLKPEAAILAAVFSLQEFAHFDGFIASEHNFLDMECERLIERYATRMELAGDNPQLCAESERDMLSVIAEDLEGLVDLISLCRLSYDLISPKIATLLNIIETQIQCQIMLVDAVIEMHSALDKPLKSTAILYDVNGYSADNVIIFPSKVAA